MRPLTSTAALASLFPIVAGIINDPVGIYLNAMCYPTYFIYNSTYGYFSNERNIFDLRNSPFPCEQALYIQVVCTANGTREIDFLAEQECLCNGGNFWELNNGCNDCFWAHGFRNGTLDQASSTVASLSAAECTPSPPYQPYSNLLTTIDRSDAAKLPPMTLTNDRFPNDTAVSHYWTSKGVATLGKITGSATGRLTRWTNTDGVRFTPTSTPPSSSWTGGTALGSSATTSSSSSVSASGNSRPTDNAAMKGGADSHLLAAFCVCLLSILSYS
ncbi:MAG: hypothetical protein Q9227_007681 [Pyrenula ochraceoflavens]